MFKAPLLTLTTLFTIVSVGITDRVKISCVSDSTCNSGHSYAYEANGDTIVQCTNLQTCPFDIIELQVYPCNQDFIGQTCDSKLCFLSLDRVVCGDDRVPYCPHLETINITCGQCQNLNTGNSTNCSTNKCLKAKNEEICYLGNQCSFTSIQVDFKECDNGHDMTDTFCTCCGRFHYSGNIGECVDNYDFENTAFSRFAENFTNGGTDDDSDNSFEDHLAAGLLALFIIVINLI